MICAASDSKLRTLEDSTGPLHAGALQNEGQLRKYVTSYISSQLAKGATPAPPSVAPGAAPDTAAQPPAAEAPAAAAAAASSSPAASDVGSPDGDITAAGSKGLVGPDGALLSGLRRPVVLAALSVAAAAAAMAWIAWSRSGRG